MQVKNQLVFRTFKNSFLHHRCFSGENAQFFQSVRIIDKHSSIVDNPKISVFVVTERFSAISFIRVRLVSLPCRWHHDVGDQRFKLHFLLLHGIRLGEEETSTTFDDQVVAVNGKVTY